MKKPIRIVPLEDIPKANDVPIENLAGVFCLMNQMESLCSEQNGVGFSATQTGMPWKLFVIKRRDSFEYYLNCEYQGISEKGKSIEGCLSLRDEDGSLRRFEVERYKSIRVKGKQLKIVDSKLTFEDVYQVEDGLISIIFQHEIDHFEGRDKMVDRVGIEIELTR
jgi:peptide deformylase